MERIDVHAPAHATFNHNYRRCVGTGRVDLALQRGYQEALRICREEIGFEAIRGHGLLSDFTGAYQASRTKGTESSPVEPPLHNFSRIVRILDAWIEQGVEPFLELGFMPHELASGTHTHFWWRANTTPPANYNAWAALVADLFRVLIRRYGRRRVRGWNVEVWNEPDIAFWMPPGDKQEHYFELYRRSAEAVKGVDPEIPVGGPATCPMSPEWIADLIDHCGRHDIPLDFVSTHLYMASLRDFRGEFSQSELYTPADRLEQARRIRAHVAESARPELPLHITEWNTSYSPMDLVHETTLNAAYAAWLIAHVDELFDSYSYWTFSDAFEETGIPSAPFHGGFGLVTEDGIRKPTFHAFAFAAQLGTEVLHRSEHSLVTRREDGSVAALLFNPVLDDTSNPDTGPRSGEGDVDIDLELESDWPEAVMIRRSVNNADGTAYTAWKELGRPRYPGAAELEVLRAAQHPTQRLQRIAVRDGRAQVKLRLPANGIELVVLRNRRDESAEYRELPEREWYVR